MDGVIGANSVRHIFDELERTGDLRVERGDRNAKVYFSSDREDVFATAKDGEAVAE